MDPLARWRRPRPFKPELAARAIELMAESGEHYSLIAIRSRLHPDEIGNWLVTGMREDGPEPYREWALSFLAAEAEHGSRALASIRAAITLAKVPETETNSLTGLEMVTDIEKFQQKERDQAAKHAEWLLKNRYGTFYGTSKERVAPSADLVNTVLRAEAQERRKLAAKLVDSLPPEAQRALLPRPT